jgi:hypothetical protein
MCVFVRGGKHRQYLSWENMEEFIKTQNESRVDSVGIDHYERKAKDLIEKYTQYDEEVKYKGLIDLLIILFVLTLLKGL